MEQRRREAGKPASLLELMPWKLIPRGCALALAITTHRLNCLIDKRSLNMAVHQVTA